ncbi:MAG: MBL fold metallo-hydrolase [Candidatus Hodarchaeales archaeon]|jgi:L-ascorbate metabolism protein UlaG (beta-lactamase superfamily)
MENPLHSELKINPVIHGSLFFEFQGKVIHVDPISRADYSSLPKADVILITHQHRDHLEPELIEKLRKPNTTIIGTESCSQALEDYLMMKNGDQREVEDLIIEAVPAYNIVRERSPGVKFHPKGEGNGYVITFGDKRVYIAGDTEGIPEMKDLKNIDIAFVPINLPYTMTPEEAAECVKQFRPRVVYPYHQGQSNPQDFAKALEGEKEIEIRIVELP